MDIHTRQLRYFMELAKCLNFTKAAMNLFIAQPALSQQIADLEKQLGVTLFERNSRSVTLTPAGKILQDACPEILNKLESIEQQVLWAQAGLRGSIKLGYLDVFQPFLPSLVRQFRQLYPDIALEFYSGSLKELRTALELGDIDIVFSWIYTREIPPERAPAYNILWQEDLCIAVSKEHPFVTSGGTNYALLEDETFILIDENTSPGFQFLVQEATSEIGLMIKNRANSKHFSSIITQVEAGMGASILPARMQYFTYCPTENTAFIPIKRACMDFGVAWYDDSKNAALPLFLDVMEKTDFTPGGKTPNSIES